MSSSKVVGNFPAKDKILLITGGGSGIGLAFVKLFHSQGGRVLVGDLKLTSEAENFLHETEASDRPGSVVFTSCDVTDWKALESLVTTSVNEFGAVPDVYCPCAGIFEPPWSNFWDDNEDGGYATIKINVEHPIKLSRLAIRALAGADKKGVVLLVGSISSLRGHYGCTLYTASKHAVVGLCKSLAAADDFEGVKVVCICPGLVATPLWEDRQDDKAKAYRYEEDTSPKNTPDEIAEAMLRLVEDEQYGGGTVLVKSPVEEKVVHKFEPGPTSLHDFTHSLSAVAKERGKGWKIEPQKG